MNKRGILFIVTIFMTVTVSDSIRETITQGSALGIGLRNCPSLSKVIRDNNVTDYMSNCKYSITGEKATKVTEENVLNFACFVVERAVSYICEKGLKITSEELNLKWDKNISICPMDFTVLKKLRVFKPNNLEKELNVNDQCNKVCLDLYEPKSQCVILSKVNNFLTNANKDLKNSDNTILSIQNSSTDSVRVTQDVERTEESKKPSEKQINNVNSSTKMINFTTENLESGGTETAQPNVQVQPDLKGLDEQQLSEKNADTLKAANGLPTNNEKSTDLSVASPKNNKNIEGPTSENGEFKAENESPIDEDDDGDEQLNETPDMDSFSESQNTNNVEDKSKILVEKSSFREAVNKNEISGEGFFQAEESHFFFYFLMLSSVIIIGYLAFHNKNKILAYALEGSSNRRNRRRPNPARYRKLESNLEEAISSTPTQAATSSVVY